MTMRKIILAVALMLTLAGCGGKFALPSIETVQTAIHWGTASVDNPVTPTRLNQIEAGVKVVFRSLKVWRRACIRGDLNVTCKDQIRAVQVYTIPIEQTYIPQLRRFVEQNDQVNASAVFNTITGLIASAKAKAAEAGHIVSEN